MCDLQGIGSEEIRDFQCENRYILPPEILRFSNFLLFRKWSRHTLNLLGINLHVFALKEFTNFPWNNVMWLSLKELVMGVSKSNVN